jgi:serine/threonine protein phosphatase PrpC
MREGGAGVGVPTWASLSSRGGRSDNQDRCGDTAAPGGHLFVVADGLGGHAAGAVAAEAAVSATLAAARSGIALEPERLRGLFDVAHHAVQEAQRRDPATLGCRTTEVVLALSDGRALWGHVGDTRLYHLRGGRVVSQTLDHSVPQALVQTGAISASEIRRHPDRNRLLRSLGGEGEIAPTLLDGPVALEQGDAFLLCSDGLWEHVTEPEMEESLCGAQDPATWLRRLEERVLRAARGAFDNYSATAVFLGAAGGARRAPRGSRLARVALAALAALVLAIALGRCLEPSSPGLVFGALPAPSLPAPEAPAPVGAGTHASPAGRQLHSTAAGPSSAGRP